MRNIVRGLALNPVVLQAVLMVMIHVWSPITNQLIIHGSPPMIIPLYSSHCCWLLDVIYHMRVSQNRESLKLVSWSIAINGQFWLIWGGTPMAWETTIYAAYPLWRPISQDQPRLLGCYWLHLITMFTSLLTAIDQLVNHVVCHSSPPNWRSQLTTEANTIRCAARICAARNRPYWSASAVYGENNIIHCWLFIIPRQPFLLVESTSAPPWDFNHRLQHHPGLTPCLDLNDCTCFVLQLWLNKYCATQQRTS